MNKRKHPVVPFDQLTRREHAVMQLIVKGLSNKLIAAALNVSEHTAKFHVTNLLNKLCSSTRVEIAVNYALWQASLAHQAALAAALKEPRSCEHLVAAA